MRPLLSLVMILKNEAQSIRAVLEAVTPYVDSVTILDTGSTDGTQAIVKEVCSADKLAIHEEPFVDFASSRNRVMELDAQRSLPAAFQLMLSGDEYLAEGASLREYLETQRGNDVDCHVIKLSMDSRTLFTPRVFRTGSPWRYIRKLHEFPTHPNKDAKVGAVPNAAIEHVVSDVEKRMSTVWEVHIPMLQQMLVDNPDDTHAMTFLAQSYEDLFHGFDPEEKVLYMREAITLRTRRMLFPFESEAERNFCVMNLINDMALTGDYSDEQVYKLAEQLCEADPYRPEAALLRAELAKRVLPLAKVYALADHATKVAAEAHKLVNASVVDMSCAWKAHYLAAVCARQYAAKHPSTAFEGETFENRFARHVQAGLDAGGEWSAFRALAAEPPKPATEGA